MKKLKVITLIIVVLLVLVSCSKKRSDEKLIEEFIKLNYSEYKEDSKIMKGIDYSVFKENSDKKAKDAYIQIDEKYNKYIDENCFRNLMFDGTLSSYLKSDDLEKIELKNLKINEKENSKDGVIFEVNYDVSILVDGEEKLLKGIVAEFTVDMAFQINEVKKGEDRRIVKIKGYLSPIQIINDSLTN